MTHRRLFMLLSLCTACSASQTDETTGEDTSASASETGGTTQSAATDDTVDPTTDATTEAPEPGTTGTSEDPDPTDGPDPTTEGPDPTTGDPDPTGDPPAFVLPTANAGFDYQIGGAYEPPRGVTVVSRDRNDPPAAGLYNICYVNGYQTQPDEAEMWMKDHPELILRDANDEPVIDGEWNEMLLDIRTPESRAALAEIVGGWISQCKTDGYQAVEIDNLDSYDRSDDLLDQDQAVLYMALLSEAAHTHGLAIAQKNSTELLPRRDEMGTDFAVVEECNHYMECNEYIDTYGDLIYVIEYEDGYFSNGCKEFSQISIVRRDLLVSMPGDPEYVFDGC